jgi:hypothetical protein
VRIDNPKRCREQLKEALAIDGPAVIECITDPNEPPMPPKVTSDEMKKFAKALVRGERDRTRIGLTIGRSAMDEMLFPASSYGPLGRAKEKVTGGSKKEDR